MVTLFEEELEGLVVGEDREVFTQEVCTEFLEGTNDCQEFLVMNRVVELSTS